MFVDHAKPMPTELIISLAKAHIEGVGAPHYVGIMPYTRSAGVGYCLCQARVNLNAGTKFTLAYFRCGHVYFVGKCPACDRIFWADTD